MDDYLSTSMCFGVLTDANTLPPMYPVAVQSLTPAPFLVLRHYRSAVSPNPCLPFQTKQSQPESMMTES